MSKLKLSISIVFLVLLITRVLIITLITLGYFAASKPVTYLPEIHQNDLKQPSIGIKQFELKNSKYVLLVKENGENLVKSIDGDTIIVGARFDDDNGPDTGSAYIFEKGITWPSNERFKTTASDGLSGDRFGWSVGVS